MMHTLGRFGVLSLLAVGLALRVSLGAAYPTFLTAHAASGHPPIQLKQGHQDHEDGFQARVRVVPSPSPGTNANELLAIETISSRNIWAVGIFADTGAPAQTLIEHWNGLRWSVVPSPSPGSATNFLNGIEAISATDIWAVGAFGNTGGANQTLIEHWNGVIWSVVPSPSPGTASSVLNAIDAVSASDIWAVGAAGGNTLIEHWDGTTWSVVPSPSPGSLINPLFGVEAISAANVWAVGRTANTGTGSLGQTLIEHWDGTVWSVVTSTSPGSFSNQLDGIDAVSPNDIWAVGSSSNSVDTSQTLVEHWDGTTWSVVPSPNPGSFSTLAGIETVSADDIWAVGNFASSVSSPAQTLIEHWDGQRWTVVPSPSPGSKLNLLFAVDAASAKDIWASGSFQNTTGPEKTLVERIKVRRED